MTASSLGLSSTTPSENSKLREPTERAIENAVLFNVTTTIVHTDIKQHCCFYLSVKHLIKIRLI